MKKIKRKLYIIIVTFFVSTLLIFFLGYMFLSNYYIENAAGNNFVSMTDQVAVEFNLQSAAGYQSFKDFVDDADQNNLSQIQNSLPPTLAKAFGNIVNNVINPLLNMVKNIPATIQNISNFINELKTQIYSTMEKLTAIIGEVKNFISSKIKKEYEKIKKKILSLFGFYIIESGEDEEILREIEIRESKKIKNLLLKLFGEEKEDYEYQQPENGEGEQLKKD